MRRVAIFDLDRTITTFGTFTPFLLSTRATVLSRALLLGRFSRDMLAYKRGAIDRKTLKNRMLKTALEGASRQSIIDRAQVFVEKTLGAGLRSKALDAVNRHIAEGDLLVLATASVDFYAELFAERLGFDVCVSTATTFAESIEETPRIVGENCYGRDKLAMVISALKRATGESREQQHWTFYSDHQSDFVLLAESDAGFVVSPTAKAKKAALSNNFSILDW